MARRKKRKYLHKILVIIFLSLCFYLGYYFKDAFLETSESHEIKSYSSLENVPEYSGEAYMNLMMMKKILKALNIIVILTL